MDRLSGVIIGCAFRVMNGLGAGFAEKVYENALAQCINYLAATASHLCLLLNFGKPRVEIKRIAHGL